MQIEYRASRQQGIPFFHLRYAPSPNSNGMKTELAHSTYQKTAFSDSAPKFTAPNNAYEVGWDAIDQLENRLLDDVYSARARGKPFSDTTR